MSQGAQRSHEVYRRELPGGGYVVIEVSPSRTLPGQRACHAEVLVERRIQPDRRGRAALLVAQADAPDLDKVLHELFPVAHSNIAIAIGCLERTRQPAQA